MLKSILASLTGFGSDKTVMETAFAVARIDAGHIEALHTRIPTYGVSGIFGDPDGNGAHGLNERARVRSVYEGRSFMYDVVKLYANAPKPEPAPAPPPVPRT